MEELKTGCCWEFLHTDDLALIAESLTRTRDGVSSVETRSRIKRFKNQSNKNQRPSKQADTNPKSLQIDGSAWFAEKA